MPSLKHDYDRLVNQAIVEMIGASEAGINQALFEVFHDFFNYTGLWEEDISVPITAGTSTFDLVSPTAGEIVRLSVIRNSGNFPVGGWLSNDRTQLVLKAPLNTTDTFTVTVKKTVALPITRDGRCEIPDYVLPLWGPVIYDGLKARMYLQSSKPYTNPSAAGFHLKRYEYGKQACRASVRHGHLASGQAWAFPGGWRTRNQRGFTNTVAPQ